MGGYELCGLNGGKTTLDIDDMLDKPVKNAAITNGVPHWSRNDQCRQDFRFRDAHHGHGVTDPLSARL